MTEPPPLTGDKVRELRIAAGMSQYDLADVTGLNRGTIQLIERGARITPRSMLALSKAFPEVQAPTSVLEQVLGELQDIKTQIAALTSGRAA